MLLMSIHGGAMFAHTVEQMRRIRRSDALGREMPANVEIGWIFSFFNDLMVLLRFANGVLLRMNIIGEAFVTRFIFAAHFRNIFFDRGKLLFGGGEFFLRHSRGVAAAESGAHQFVALFR